MLDRIIIVSAILFFALFVSTNVNAQTSNTITKSKTVQVESPSVENIGGDGDMRTATSPSSTQPVKATTVKASDEPVFEEVIGGSGADERTNEEPLSVPVETIQTRPAKAPEE